MQIDVFNGDADGICALIQLRLAKPLKSQLVTGVKRDIQLLNEVKVQHGDKITVLDISFAKNEASVNHLLEQGAKIFYVDHHQAGEIPEHKNLHTLINTDANTCTSLLINDYLQGKYRGWAVTAAFGDNLFDSAKQVAYPLSLSKNQLQQLKTLGICINYNSYGSSIADLHFAPDLLYHELQPYHSPFDFMTDNSKVYEKLLSGYSDDMAAVKDIKAEYKTDKVAVFILTDEIWAKRVSGVFGNELASNNPDYAHAVVSFNDQNAYQVSVRAPLNNKTGADELCASFPTGGGRMAAAGINHLPFEDLPSFISAFEKKYS
ncbi:MAG: DHH family phosphoesterase [Methylococcales symbiont of Hymedesmia sp. n. MRB-2018]|nr:MAG: DHH family phosphoesterase [Methylococcales symbiont of Hymedesmia sp. n. MRB-2018]KAF3983063.1 MAG: DHH family phosphoesterase [Methylococcales symbiont of Hymedesmia sp. n. MRB-2018]